jgi:acyl CoA:acetate/3-ketoacid CoA transferase beta subunit
MKNNSFSAGELMAVCISRQIVDGEIVAQGIATPLVAAGYLLAKLTHAPNLTFVSAIGQSICQDAAQIGLATIEKLWIKQGKMTIGFVEGAADFLPTFGPKEFFRPGQVDPFGNFNNIYIGGSYKYPRLRLPGSGGIPDVTSYGDNIYLYVPRHGRHTFVKSVDFRSGLGHDPGRKRGAGAHYLISDLGQFDFDEESGRMRIQSLHPGVSLERLKVKTGFELLIPSKIPETDGPTTEELRLIREEIDPFEIRTLETLGGVRRKQKLIQILEEEAAHF